MSTRADLVTHWKTELARAESLLGDGPRKNLDRRGHRAGGVATPVVGDARHLDRLRQVHPKRVANVGTDLQQDSLGVSHLRSARQSQKNFLATHTII